MNAEDVKGWMTVGELAWLTAQAARMGSVAEIGCHQGRSTTALLAACPGLVYAIDPWEDEPDGRYDYVGDRDYDAFLANCGGYPNLVVVRGFSPAAAEHVPDVDMVFIDGNHDAEAVIADIEAWFPKTRRLICGHDFGLYGVNKAVDGLLIDRHVAEGTTIWYLEVG